MPKYAFILKTALIASDKAMATITPKMQEEEPNKAAGIRSDARFANAFGVKFRDYLLAQERMEKGKEKQGRGGFFQKLLPKSEGVLTDQSSPEKLKREALELYSKLSNENREMLAQSLKRLFENSNAWISGSTYAALVVAIIVGVASIITGSWVGGIISAIIGAGAIGIPIPAASRYDFAKEKLQLMGVLPKEE